MWFYADAAEHSCFLPPSHTEAGTHPELAHCIDVLGLEQHVVIAVYEAFTVDHRRIIYQDGHISHLADLCDQTEIGIERERERNKEGQRYID